MTDDNDHVAPIVQLPGTKRLPEEGAGMPITTGPDYVGCSHWQLVIDPRSGATTCRACAAKLEPLAALRILAHSGDRWANAIAVARAEVERLTRQRDELRLEVVSLQAKARRAKRSGAATP